MRIEPLTPENLEPWDRFVLEHPLGSIYHRSGWRDVIFRTTGHREAYRLAMEGGRVVGVLPLFVLSSRLFGRMAVSLPYLNEGGVLAESPEAETALAEECEKIGRESGCDYVELRQRHPASLSAPVSDRKVTSVISLEGGLEAVFARLHQNVRNKIRKAAKAGMEIREGAQHLDEFYRVYSHNLRDLGTPVMPRRFFRNIVETFPDAARIFVAIREGRVIGAKLALFDRRTCYFVWAAAIREELKHAPVHALNWAAIEAAMIAGCEGVDLGRSSRESTHQDFKKYWGVEVVPLPWTYPFLKNGEMPGLHPQNPKFELAIRLWQRLPVFLTRLIGPPLARLLP